MFPPYTPIFQIVEGILAVAVKLRQDRTKDPIAPYLLELLELVLQGTNLTFKDQNLQIGETKLGTALAPNYANLFMDRFETQALENWPLKPIIWLRFIDDIFMIWPHGNIELDHVIEYLKRIHEKTKFKSEVAPTVLMF